MDNRSRLQSPPSTITWAGAQAPVLGLCTAAVVSLGAITADTVIAGAGEPGAVLAWFPLAAAGAALLLALRAAGAVREGALAAMVAFLALFPLIHPAPAPWMYMAPFLASLVALGVLLAPTTRAIAALPVLAGLLATLEVVAQDSVATLLGAGVFAAYLLALWLELPSVALPSLTGQVAANARETGEQA